MTGPDPTRTKVSFGLICLRRLTDCEWSVSVLVSSGSDVTVGCFESGSWGLSPASSFPLCRRVFYTSSRGGRGTTLKGTSPAVRKTLEPPGLHPAAERSVSNMSSLMRGRWSTSKLQGLGSSSACFSFRFAPAGWARVNPLEESAETSLFSLSEFLRSVEIKSDIYRAWIKSFNLLNNY